MPSPIINIAIDGPSGAGKSSAARLAAQRLGFVYVDTGALYRSIAVAALRAEIAPEDASAIEALLPSLRLELRYADGAQQVFLNGENVSEEIREPRVSRAVSAVSAHPAVRAFLLGMQRGIAALQSCILDGRDIATVVLPDAQVRIFLTATPEERARRRYLELREKGSDEPYENVLADIIERDGKDAANPATASLRYSPERYTLLDNTGMTQEEVVEAIVQLTVDS